MLSAGTIIEGAFRPLRDHPAAVAVWGLLYLVAVILMSFAMRPFADFQVAAAGGDPQMAMAGMSQMMSQMFLLQLAYFIFFVVLMTAALRAVLRPGEQGFAYLQLGMDELRMIGLTLLIVVVAYIGFLLVFVVGAIVVAGAWAAGGAATAVPLAFILLLALLGGVIWLEVRLSLAFPLTLLRGRIIIGESWRLTRGRFWTLFAGYLVVFLIILAIAIAAGLATAGSYLSDLMRNAGDPEAMQRAMEAQMDRQFGEITPMMVLGWLLSAAVGVITVALMGGAVATAARALAGDEESIADTFA
jgi:hypothetical protein